MTSGFDIRSILDFNPPKYVCEACRGLFWEFDRPEDRWGDRRYWCPSCRTLYELWEQAERKYLEPYDYLERKGLVIDYGKDLLSHARTLATLIKSSAEPRGTRQTGWPTQRLLFETLSRARHFVHFASWGISHVMIGALKVTSMRVPVFGFVSDVESSVRVELSEYPREAPRLKAHVVESRQAAFDAPHQKIVVVDGLVAFKGSMNLTNAGMRRADRGLDVSEVVTNFQEVTDLNNKYFSPVWKRLTHAETTRIEYDDASF